MSWPHANGRGFREKKVILGPMSASSLATWEVVWMQRWQEYRAGCRPLSALGSQDTVAYRSRRLRIMVGSGKADRRQERHGTVQALHAKVSTKGLWPGVASGWGFRPGKGREMGQDV